MVTRTSLSRSSRRAFSLIELLVVIGIIAVLIGILAPALSAARRQAKKVQCMTQLRELGHALQIYQNENNGWLYPCYKSPASGKTIPHWGTAVPPHERWPMKAFKVKSAPNVLPYNPDDYDPNNLDPVMFPAEPFTPPNQVCPADDRPQEAHSYVLNAHLCEREIKAGDKNFGGLTVSDVILAGEKRALVNDYYMQADDFDRVIEKYRHGRLQGSNFLKLDGHVDTSLPQEAMTGVDPWDLNTPVPVTP
jgi:prepilin-type N-terminal cleavage/methylation domain-containing protein/prepilin-type processing-associated H-X9-DG protein